MNWFYYAFDDIRRNKVKSSFGIMGIAISIMLLTVVGSLNDSISFSYLDQATAQSGSADIIFSRQLQADINFDLFFDQNLIESKLQGKIDEIDYYFPRILMLAELTHLDPDTNKNIQKRIIFYGINSTLEQNSNKMGDLYLCDANRNPTKEIFKGPIPNGHCILTRTAAKLFNVKVGDNITLRYLNDNPSLVVDAIVQQNLRFSSVENTLIITELSWAQSFLKQNGRVNYVLSTIRNREYVYDTRDIQGTIRELRLVAEEIQNLIGFEYQVTLPKMMQLEYTEQTSQTMTIMFLFLTIFSMMITGILINSILSTNIEERIREFGIMLVVGSKKNFPVGLVMTTGFIMSIIGTGLGILLGLAMGPIFLTWVYGTFSQFLEPLQFIILPETILLTASIGIGITTVISFIPALKAARIHIVKAIDPTRSKQQENEFQIKKEGSVSARLMLFGIGIATIGLLIFILFPRIIALGDMNLTVTLFVALLLCVLLGLVFACVGIVPIFEKLISQIFKPFIKKYFPVYELSLSRYRRRNTGNVVMFALTFSFIFFISSFLEMRDANAGVFLEFQYGSDLVLSNSGNPLNNNSVDIKLYNELNEFPGIKSTAPILHNSIDFAKIGSIVTTFTEEGIDFDTFDFDAIFGTIPKQSAYVGDIGGYREQFCNIIGVNETYVDTINKDLLMWDTSTGSSDDSFTQLFNNRNSCIIAKALADELGVTELGQTIRVTFYPEDEGEDIGVQVAQGYMWGVSRGMGNITLLKVVGVSAGMPGVWNFRSSQINLGLGLGVMLNMEDYLYYMNYDNPNGNNQLVDKVLINLIDNSEDNIKEMQTFIKNYFGETYKFIIDEAGSKIALLERQNASINMIMNALLFFAIIISLFGLISSMYATMLERMFELGILRTMGLKSYEVRTMLMIEAITIMLAAGTMGMLIGILISYLLMTNMAILTEMPVVVALNISTLAMTYLWSIGICIVGMWLITQRVKNWSIVEILRHTF